MAVELRDIEGFGPILVARIRYEFPNDEWREQPYLLTEVRGVGFKRADSVAMAMGVRKDAPARINAGGEYALKEAEMRGHTCLPVAEFGKLLAETLETSLPRSLELDDRFCEADGFISRQRTTNAERAVATGMTLLSQRSLPESNRPREEGMHADQVAALRVLDRANVFAMMGGPGTGKTYSVKRIADAVSAAGGEVLLCAPTGKAAKRIEELSGRKASTIHRMLGVLHPESSEYRNAPSAHSGGFRFKFNRKHPLRADLVIVDESSMLDCRLAADLVEALGPTTRLILIGDPFQLPAVGPGNVLHDLTSAGGIPNVELTELKRQDPDLLIARNCKSIRFDRKVIVNNDLAQDFFFYEYRDPIAAQAAIVEYVAEHLPEKYGYEPDQIQVLAPLREKGELSVKALNCALRAKLNPDAANFVMPWKGDRIIQLSNDYKLDIMNGDTGRILEASQYDLVIEFDTPKRVVEEKRAAFDIDLAYALTVHKYQGSEQAAVVIAIDPSGPAQYLAEAQLTYTAISRARDVCTCIGSRRALDAQAARHRAMNRYTRLKGMLTAGG